MPENASRRSFQDIHYTVRSISKELVHLRESKTSNSGVKPWPQSTDSCFPKDPPLSWV